MIVALLSIVVVDYLDDYSLNLAPTALLGIWVLLYNLLASGHLTTIKRWKGFWRSRRWALTGLFILAVFDLFALAVGIHFTGGVASPYILLLYLYAVGASVVFRPPVSYVAATMTISLLGIVAYLEYAGISPHYALGSLPQTRLAYGRAEDILVVMFLFGSLVYLGAYTVGYVTSRLQRKQLEVTRLLQQQERNLAQLAALQRIGTEISSLTELDRVLELIVNKARELFSTDTAYLALCDDAKQELCITVTCGENSETLRGLKLRYGQGMGGLVVAQRKPVIVADYATDPRLVDRMIEVSTRDGLKSGLAVPIAMEQRIIGVLFVFNRQTTLFDDKDADLLLALATQAAIAIENANLYVELQKAALTDSLTGLYNSRYLAQRLPAEIARADRYGGKLSLIMADCDSLKTVNDTFGHHVGDRLLVELGRIMRDTVRESDIVVRYAGDEFVVLLPDADVADVHQVGERVRHEVADYRLDVGNGLTSVTISLGLATYPVHAEDAESLLQKADNALYRAKNLGKNRVCQYATAA